jgi:hypothetical protein
MTVITRMIAFGLKDCNVGITKGNMLYNVRDFITSGNKDVRFPFGG